MKGKSLRDLDAAISNISRSLQAYYAGDPYAYLPVAVELRKLLCEQKRGQDESLVLRDNPKFALHPLTKSSLPIDGPNVFLFRGPKSFNGRRSGYLGSLFDETQHVMPLSEWREQQLVSQDITIRNLIKSVADKEAAHSDRDGNATLGLLQSVRYGGGAGADAEHIASIGHYILRNLLVRRLLFLRAELMINYKGQRASQGPGALRLLVQQSPRPYSDGMALDYITSEAVRGIEGNESFLRAADMMEAHCTSSSFLLWIVDLRGEVWLNEIRAAG